MVQQVLSKLQSSACLSLQPFLDCRRSVGGCDCCKQGSSVVDAVILPFLTHSLPS